MSSGKWRPSCLGLNVLIKFVNGHVKHKYQGSSDEWIDSLCFAFQGEYSVPITYQNQPGEHDISIDNVREVVRRSETCTYHLKIECVFVHVVAATFWVTFNNERKTWVEADGSFCDVYQQGIYT